MHHANKGIIAVRIEFTDDVEIADLDITELHNFGGLGSNLCGEYDGPEDAGGHSGGTPEEGYMGADVRAISMSDVGHVELHDLNIRQIHTESGNAIGIDVREDSVGIIMTEIDICEVVSYLDVPTGVDLPNPNEDPCACGVTVDDTSDVELDSTVTAGALSAEEPCESEFANAVDAC
eukprot:TRINITY_DN6659_c0_g1_i1.p1 TRINITY_DN6659_c0_g1~~TRINITY_DN6659_c0_g1_i1.p1  ORF type:complete len:177 (-),score=38.31 TRINITY_DN6659_c0_g1_i1:244-774(-)